MLPPQVKDITGQRFGKLTVESYEGVSSQKESLWRCYCECGNYTVVSRKRLVTANTRSCGCLKIELQNKRSENYRNSFISKKYGRLTVTKVYPGEDGLSRCDCICTCGESITVRLNDLTSGDTKSCGCYFRETVGSQHITHGMAKHPLYDTWNDMIQRCYNPNAPNFKYYGGRGIGVCKQWKNSPKNFIEWAVENGYRKGLTLDRENNNGSYQPSNCRWVTMVVQNRNQSNTKLTEADVMSIREDLRTTKFLSELYGVSETHIRQIRRGKIWKLGST